MVLENGTRVKNSDALFAYISVSIVLVIVYRAKYHITFLTATSALQPKYLGRDVSVDKTMRYSFDVCHLCSRDVLHPSNKQEWWDGLGDTVTHAPLHSEDISSHRRRAAERAVR